MSIAVANLITTQIVSPLKAGKNNITFTYNGKVDYDSDNNISITGEIVNTDDVVFDNTKTSQTPLEDRTFGVGSFTIALTSSAVLEVKQSSAYGAVAQLKLTFVTANGDEISKYTSVIY